MTQIVVTLEEGSDTSLIRNTIKMIKGVKNTLVKKSAAKDTDSLSQSKLHAFDQLAGILTISDIDESDEKAQSLLRK